MSKFPIEMIYGTLAIAGGVVRYLSAYTRDGNFSIRVFFANALISGFSGYMFALLGESMNLPHTMLLIMAGTGGFMGTAAMDIVVEYLSKNVKNPLK